MDLTTLFEPGHGTGFQQSAFTSVDEVVLPGSSTQRHTHPDIEETIYVLTGTGIAVRDDREIEIGPGSALC